MNRRYHRLMTALIFVMLLIPMAKNLVLAPKEFSDLENRVLSQKILWNRDLLKSGVLAERTEAYFQDQFPLRDAFINLKSDVQVLMGKKRNNGIHQGKDGYLFPVTKVHVEEVLRNNLQAILDLEARYSDRLKIVVVPPSSLVHEEKLPEHVGTEQEIRVLEEIRMALSGAGGYVDAHEVLNRHADEAVYFRTDHHWTQYGAYLLYQELMNSMSKEPVDIATFTVHKVQDFQGTYYSRFRGNLIPGEEFTLFESTKGQYSLEFPGEGRVEDRILFKENLSLRDKYRVYLDGNYPLAVMRNDEAMSGEKILVLKDSYANAMAPFLADSFGEVHFLDLRYYNLSLEAYIEEEGFDQVVLLYGMDSLLEDVNLKKLAY